MNEPLASMFHYNRWANLVLFEACRELTSEQFDIRVEGVSGSVRELLLHTAGGQQTFVLRTSGRHHEGELNRGSAWPGLETLIKIAERSSDDLITIAEGVENDVRVELPWQGKAYRYPKSFFLLHALAHGVEHRTEVKVALAQIGVRTPDLDAWVYAAAAGYGEAV